MNDLNTKHASNKFIYCSENKNLDIRNNCDNSDFCKIEGCKNCYTVDECAICSQGRYKIGGLCKKCIKGCASCSNNKTCVYCLSGFELTKNKTCQLTNIFDFDLKSYNDYNNKSYQNKCNVENWEKCFNNKRV